MSLQITTAFVQQYKNNVQFLSQQKGSRLRGLVRNETQQGESEFFEQVGATAAVKKAGRHTPTPRVDTPHSRRRVTLNDYEWSDLIDKQDKIRMLIDPASPYAQSAAWALGRGMDDEIISAAVGTAYTDKTGSTAVSLATNNRVAAQTTTTLTNLNLNALIQAKFLLDSKDVDPSVERFIAVNASGIQSLLQTTQVQNIQYNTVRALVEGNIDTFLGFKFVRIERLLATVNQFKFDSTTGLYNGSGTTVNAGAGITSLFAWAKDGLLLSTGMDIMGRIDERADMSYSTQVYAAGSFGATRMEENKVVEIICQQ